MSTDLILNVDQPLTLPSYLQGTDFKVSDGLLATIGQGGNRIGLKGNRFRQVINGKEEGVWDENYLDVIILGAVPAISRVYYEGAYEQDVKAAPTCYSADGIAPPDDVKNKQSDKCATCPQNQKGSKIINGNKIKACGFFQRLIVMLAGDLEGVTYRLDVKSMGIFGESHANVNKYNIRDYTKFVSNRGVDVAQIVTRLSFDTDSSVPKLLFQPSRFIEADEFAVVSEKVRSKEVEQMLVINMTTVDLSAETDATTASETPDTVRHHPADPEPSAPVVKEVAAPAIGRSTLAMTAKGAEFGTYEDFIGNGWTDAQLIAEGYCEAPKPALPPKPAVPAVPKPTPAAAPQATKPVAQAPQRAARAPTAAPRAAAPAKPAPVTPTKPATPQPQKPAPRPAQAPTIQKGVPIPQDAVQETATDEDVEGILASLEL